MNDFTAYAVGVCSASVCTSLSDEAATAMLNIEHPSGVGPWAISGDSHFADGVHTNPCPCSDAPETNRHILFDNPLAATIDGLTAALGATDGEAS